MQAMGWCRKTSTPMPTKPLQTHRESTTTYQSPLSHIMINWSALPQDVLLLIAHRCPRSTLIAAASVCKAWYPCFSKELSARKEPLLLFWDNSHDSMLLFRSGMGFSPSLQNCIPSDMTPPLLLNGPWLFSWKSRYIKCRNLCTKELIKWHLDTTVKAGVVSVKDDVSTHVLCIQLSRAVVPEQLVSVIANLEDQTIERGPTPYTCPDKPCASAFTPTLKLHPYHDSDNLIIFNEAKCAFFLLSLNQSSSKSLLLWYKWDSETWGSKGKIHTPHCFLFVHVLFFHQPLVNLNGRLGLVQCSKINNGSFSSAVNLEICFLTQGQIQGNSLLFSSSDLFEDKTDQYADHNNLEKVAMPEQVWRKFCDIVKEIDDMLDPSDKRSSIIITARQCDPRYVHLICTFKSMLIAIIVYDVQRDLWEIISRPTLGQPALGCGRKYFVIPLTPDDLLAKVALSSYMILSPPREKHWFHKLLGKKASKKEKQTGEQHEQEDPNYDRFKEYMYIC